MNDIEINYIKEDEQFEEWFKIVKPIITTEEFLKRKYIRHHEDSVYSHSILVSFYAYKMAKDETKEVKRNVAIAGVLHDFYTRAWQYSESLKYIDESFSARFTDKKNNRDLHGFTHPKDALRNSNKFFKKYLNKRIENAIVRHMFPLTIIPPKYKEGWLITLADKAITFKNLPKLTELPKYVGIDLLFDMFKK